MLFICQLCQVVAGVSFTGTVRLLLVRLFYTEPGRDAFLPFSGFNLSRTPQSQSTLLPIQSLAI